jgi:hypothetical protein
MSQRLQQIIISMTLAFIIIMIFLSHNNPNALISLGVLGLLNVILLIGILPD